LKLEIVLESGVFVIALLTVGLAGAAEIALALVNRGWLQEALDNGMRQAQAVQTLLDDTERSLSTLLVVETVGVAAAMGAVVLLVRRVRPDWLGLLLGCLVLVVVVIGMRVIGRALAARSPEAWALSLAWLVQALAMLLSPLVALMRGLGDRILGPASELAEESILLTEDGLRFLINVGEEESAIEDEEKEMIASIVELGETLVREVMVPRIDVISLSVETPITEALDVIIAAGYSRIPIYEETIDNIVGMLYAKDLLGCFRDGKRNAPIAGILREVYFVPESMKVDDLLHELQRRRVHVAIVVDEYGGTAGLVTIEDLLEEIVGEIQDEYDMEEPLVLRVSDREWLIHARCNLDDACDLLEVTLPSEGGDTVGGFIFSQLERVPEVGDEVLFDDLRITVQSVDGRRVKQVRVLREEPPAEEPPSGQQAVTSGLLSFLMLG
jgi:CBS domain containing-hemolysin-like protein